MNCSHVKQCPDGIVTAVEGMTSPREGCEGTRAVRFWGEGESVCLGCDDCIMLGGNSRCHSHTGRADNGHRVAADGQRWPLVGRLLSVPVAVSCGPALGWLSRGAGVLLRWAAEGQRLPSFRMLRGAWVPPSPMCSCTATVPAPQRPQLW